MDKDSKHELILLSVALVFAAFVIFYNSLSVNIVNSNPRLIAKTVTENTQKSAEEDIFADEPDDFEAENNETTEDTDTLYEAQNATDPELPLTDNPTVSSGSPSKTSDKAAVSNNASSKSNVSSKAQSKTSSTVKSSVAEVKSIPQIININTAPKEHLEDLTGIGPALAQAIIDNRPYQTIEDIKNVPRIGDKTFDKIKARITV